MLPMTDVTHRDGPFTDTYGTVFERTSSGKRQKRPYNLVTSYTLSVFKRLFGPIDAGGITYGPSELGYNYPYQIAKIETDCKNRAYGKLVNKLGESASFGATLTAELRETWGMLVGTVLRITEAARAVKKFRFVTAARILGVPYRERMTRVRVGYYYSNRFIRGRWRRVRVPRYVKREMMQFGTYREIEKSLAGGWLLWSYGVKPLAEDLYSAMEHWGKEIPRGSRVSGRAEAQATVNLGSWSSFYTLSVKIGVVCIARVSVNNAQLWNANKLGLVNPAQWILEGIPFSFVVDWFSNLSQVIMSMTDMLGLKVEDAVTCQQHTIQEVDLPVLFPSPARGKEQFFSFRRPGLITPKLQFGYERFSWQRGLNAIALLVGFKP